jgi:hypothetical protein
MRIKFRLKLYLNITHIDLNTMPKIISYLSCKELYLFNYIDEDRPMLHLHL